MMGFIRSNAGQPGSVGFRKDSFEPWGSVRRVPMNMARICGNLSLYKLKAFFIPSPPLARLTGVVPLSAVRLSTDAEGVAGCVTLSTGSEGGGGGHLNRLRLYAFEASSMKVSRTGKGEGTGM